MLPETHTPLFCLAVPFTFTSFDHHIYMILWQRFESSSLLTMLYRLLLDALSID